MRVDAGPNNHWLKPEDGHAKIDALFDWLYAGPYDVRHSLLYGPDRLALLSLRRRDHGQPYVVVNMKLMTRMGKKALQRIEKEGTFVRGLHSTGDLDPERRFIMHFPDELRIKSIGSGYGGNALLGKKCHALAHRELPGSPGRLAWPNTCSSLASKTRRRTHYIACAFPSACGKTNLAMLIPPESLPGWKSLDAGRRYCLAAPRRRRQLRAINPESGYFGVVPGTNPKTNKNAYDMIMHDTIFTNVAVTDDGEPWWEGKNVGAPAKDWQGRDYDAGNGKAAHPNSRFTVAADNNPCYLDLARHRRRADLGHRLRRTPQRTGATGLREQKLAARRARRCRRCLRNDCRKRR